MGFDYLVMVVFLLGFSNNGERREKKSDFEVSEDDDKKTRVGGIFRKKSSKTKFRHSLKRKGSSSRTRSIDRTLSLTFEDIHDAEELRYVSQFRQSLISDHLLPPNLDDYHIMLRSIFYIFHILSWDHSYMFHHMLCLSREIIVCFMIILLSADSCSLGNLILEKQS